MNCNFCPSARERNCNVITDWQLKPKLLNHRGEYWTPFSPELQSLHVEFSCLYIVDLYQIINVRGKQVYNNVWVIPCMLTLFFLSSICIATITTHIISRHFKIETNRSYNDQALTTVESQKFPFNGQKPWTKPDSMWAAICLDWSGWAEINGSKRGERGERGEGKERGGGRERETSNSCVTVISKLCLTGYKTVIWR